MCKEKEGAEADDFVRFIEFELPKTKEGKCLIACVNEMNVDVRIKMKSQSFISNIKFFLIQFELRILDRIESMKCLSI